jgi:hypothetical protein
LDFFEIAPIISTEAFSGPMGVSLREAGISFNFSQSDTTVFLSRWFRSDFLEWFLGSLWCFPSLRVLQDTCPAANWRIQNFRESPIFGDAIFLRISRLYIRFFWLANRHLLIYTCTYARRAAVGHNAATYI